MNSNFTLPPAGLEGLGIAGMILLYGVGFILLIFSVLMPVFVYCCHRNLKKLVTLQEEANRLLRQQAAPRMPSPGLVR